MYCRERVRRVIIAWGLWTCEGGMIGENDANHY
jgi:hypothetical protein